MSASPGIAARRAEAHPDLASTGATRWSSTRIGLGVFAAWTVIALISVGQFYVYTYAPQIEDEPFSLGHNALWAFTQAYVWAPLSVLVFIFARRLPLDRDERSRSIALHIVAALAFSLVQIALSLAAESISPWRHQGAFSFTAAMTMLVSKGLHVNLLIYAIIAVLAYAREYYRMYQSRELRSARLETELAHAHLEALRSQMNPHFLFNTLNAISSLVHDDARAADRMISRLSDLLRLSLDHIGEQEIRLREELEYLSPYLEIERTRFRDRLTVQIDADADVLDARVPNLLLQPLVENAIKHGTVRHPGAHRIDIRARRRGHELLLEVEDDGAGLPAGPHVIREGIGLGNTRQRLRHLYGDHHRMDLIQGSLGGLLVRITLPFVTTTLERSEQLRRAVPA